MESIIAILSLVTAIGAIWAAVGATRQARASSRQASVAERSLDEQIRSFQIQNEFVEEQNRHARLSLELDLSYKLAERWRSQLYRNYRIRSLTYVKENHFVGDGISEVDHLDPATEQVFGFFEDVGFLTRTGVLRLERVWFEYGGLPMVWALWEPAVKKAREEWKEPELYEDMEYLYRRMIDLDRHRGIGSEHPTKEQLRRWIEQALLAEEVGREPPAGSEDPTKG